MSDSPSSNMESKQSEYPAQNPGNDTQNPLPNMGHSNDPAQNPGNDTQNPVPNMGHSNDPAQENGTQNPRGHYEGKSYSRGFSGRGSNDRGSYGRGSNDRSSYGRGSYDRSSYGGGSYGRGSYGRGSSDKWGQKMDDITISRSLSNILRHSAEKMKLKMDSNGYIYVDDLLKLGKFTGVTLSDIERVVKENDKQRFSLKLDSSSQKHKVRANQGHSIKFEHLDLDLIPIDDPEEYPNVLHGTYYSCWEFIRKQGLNKMKRVHIHFAPGLPGDDGVISGMRTSCEILIFVDLKKALQDGLKFFLSDNNVILSGGDKDGIIGPQYFSKVMDRKLGNRVDLEAADSPTKRKLPVGMTEEDLEKNKGAKKNLQKSKKQNMESKKPLPVGMSEVDLVKKDSKKKPKKNKRSDAEKYSPVGAGTIESNVEASADEIQKEEENSTEVAEVDEKTEEKPLAIKTEKTEDLDKKISDDAPDDPEEEVSPSKEEAKDSESKKKSKKSKSDSEKNPPGNENANLEDSNNVTEPRRAPKIVIIDSAEDEELSQLKELDVLAVHVLKGAVDIAYVLISVPDAVFVFDPDNTKEFLKTLLENKECQKVMFNNSIIEEMKEQFEILLEKPVFEVQVLVTLAEIRSLSSLPEINGEYCKNNPYPTFPNLENIAAKIKEKEGRLKKMLVHALNLLPLFEKYKHSLDTKDDIIAKCSKKFDEKTKIKLNELFKEDNTVEDDTAKEEGSQPTKV